MTKLPKAYQWLQFETAPRHLLKALELYGVQETIGTMHNPIIMGWAKELGIDKIYKSDEIPWCGLFMAIVIKRAEREPVDEFLRARSWANWGVNSPDPSLGDILVFVRSGGGHVGIYVGEDSKAYHVLGGNQGNAVSIVRIDKARCIAVRRPEYHTPPPNIRSITLAASGSFSSNEA